MMANRKPKETQFRTGRIDNPEDLQVNQRGTQHAARLRAQVMEEREEHNSQENPFGDGMGQVTVDDTREAKQLADTVSLNIPVVVRDLQTNEEITFTIVDCDAADPDQNRISFASPIGFALLWKRIGDSVKVNLPYGQAHYQIVGLVVESMHSVAG